MKALAQFRVAFVIGERNHLVDDQLRLDNLDLHLKRITVL